MPPSRVGAVSNQLAVPVGQVLVGLLARDVEAEYARVRKVVVGGVHRVEALLHVHGGMRDDARKAHAWRTRGTYTMRVSRVAALVQAKARGHPEHQPYFQPAPRPVGTQRRRSSTSSQAQMA